LKQERDPAPISFNGLAGEFRVSKSDDYHRRAAECLSLAKSVKDQTNRALLLEMAQTWATLAEKEQVSERSKKPQN
jgi:hypothetical protein